MACAGLPRAAQQQVLGLPSTLPPRGQLAVCVQSLPSFIPWHQGPQWSQAWVSPWGPPSKPCRCCTPVLGSADKAQASGVGQASPLPPAWSTSCLFPDDQGEGNPPSA